MLKWSKRALSAMPKFFESLQEIDVYVEDLNDESFYRALLNYAADGKIKIAKVFSKGGKIPTVNAAKIHDHVQRRALFIIDGDLHWVKGEPPLQIAGLHCHSAYCVENLLFCEKAITLIFSQELVATEVDAQRKLGYQNWQNSIRDPLIDLFATFATVNEFAPEIATVSTGVGNLCSQINGKKTQLDTEKVSNFCGDMIEKVYAVKDKKTVDERYIEIKSRISKLNNPLDAVSGKDFLLPLLSIHLSYLGCKVRTASLRLRLASTGHQERFSSLSEALFSASKGNYQKR